MDVLTHVPTDASSRKALPICKGVLDYFPDALLAVAAVSKAGNDQHNPGQPLHWAKEKSTDEADALLRHLIDRGKLDADGQRHSAKVAWRALALLQREIEGSVVSEGYRDLTEEDCLHQGDEYRAPGSDEWKPICEDTADGYPVRHCARGFSYRRKVGVAPVNNKVTVRMVRRAPSDKYRDLEDGEVVRKGDEVGFGGRGSDRWEPAKGLIGEKVNGNYKFQARRPRAEEAFDVK